MYRYINPMNTCTNQMQKGPEISIKASIKNIIIICVVLLILNLHLRHDVYFYSLPLILVFLSSPFFVALFHPICMQQRGIQKMRAGLLIIKI